VPTKFLTLDLDTALRISLIVFTKVTWCNCIPMVCGNFHQHMCFTNIL